MAVGALVGEPTYAADLNLLLPTVVVKPTATARNTTTTVAIDPDLQISLLTGTYAIRLLLFWNCVTTSTQGLKTQWLMSSGAVTTFTRGCLGPNDAAHTPDSQAIVNIGAFNNNVDCSYLQLLTGNWSAVREESYNVVVTSAGTLGLYWAQKVSSANNTSVNGGSAFEVRQIA